MDMVTGDGEGNSAYVERTSLLFRLAALLKQLATRYGLAVVLTNQVHHLSRSASGFI